jgi:hypothetical protein
MVLPTNEYQSRIDNLNFRLGEYLNTPRILTATQINEVNALLEEYRALNGQLRGAINEVSTNGDIGQITTNIGQYQEKIKSLEKELKLVKEELDTSEARKRSVERVEQDVSYKQLYIMDRPLRQLSIPTLLTLSVVFIFAGIYFLYRLWGGGSAHASGHNASGAHNQGILGFLSGQANHKPNAGHAQAANTYKGLLPTLNMPGFGLSSMFGK